MTILVTITGYSLPREPPAAPDHEVAIQYCIWHSHATPYPLMPANSVLFHPWLADAPGLVLSAYLTRVPPFYR